MALIELQPPHLYIVSIDPEPADLLQVLSGAVDNQMVVEPAARTSALCHINIVEQLSSGLSGLPQFGEERPYSPDGRLPVLRQVRIIIGQGNEQVPVVKIGRQSPFQLLE